MTGSKSGTTGMTFLQAKPHSVWWYIYKNHMTEDSFKGEMASLKAADDADEQLAAYSSLNTIQYYMKSNNRPCGMRVLWTSRQPFNYAFAFPKHSPLIPYFNHVYQFTKERGLYFGLKKQWGMVYDDSNCASGIGESMVVLSCGPNQKVSL